MTLKYFIIKNGKIFTKFKNNRLSVCLMENDDITKKKLYNYDMYFYHRRFDDRRHPDIYEVLNNRQTYPTYDKKSDSILYND